METFLPLEVADSHDKYKGTKLQILLDKGHEGERLFQASATDSVNLISTYIKQSTSILCGQFNNITPQALIVCALNIIVVLACSNCQFIHTYIHHTFDFAILSLVCFPVYIWQYFSHHYIFRYD